MGLVVDAVVIVNDVLAGVFVEVVVDGVIGVVTAI